MATLAEMRVLFIGAPVESLERPEWTQRERFERSGRNTGNLLIGSALRRQIALTSYATGSGRDPAEVDSEFDLIAIPAANFIFPRFDFGWLADFIDATRLPCLIVGLGAQSPAASNQRMNVPVGTRRFLSIVAERTKKIGVRGEFTAHVLSTLGIENVSITGCPSLFWSLDPQIRINSRPFSDEFAVSVNGSRNVVEHSYSPTQAVDVERRLLEIAMASRFDYVLQNEFPELDVLFGHDSEQTARELAAVTQTLRMEVDTQRYRDFISANARVFFSVERWLDHMSTKDFSIGTRFHGNLAALIVGVPAVVIAHDARTRELCDWFEIPSIGLDAGALLNLREVYEAADYESFCRRYGVLYRSYVDFLLENGVPTHLRRSPSEVADTSPSVGAAVDTR